VFIRVAAKPFREVAAATGSWTNHVGVVVDTSGAEPMIGESKFPLSRRTPWSAFVARSEGGRVSVARLRTELTPEQRPQVVAAADRRVGILYDTGFNLNSRRQFCSRYVREVLIEATGTSVGEVETFSHLLVSRPDANLGFWKVWYFGNIPWGRETVTPASVLRSPALRTVFDGIAVAAEGRHSN
jgi:Permuted papain-like amidase enzyme, YaeF/YiiX, C92 family